MNTKSPFMKKPVTILPPDEDEDQIVSKPQTVKSIVKEPVKKVKMPLDDDEDIVDPMASKSSSSNSNSSDYPKAKFPYMGFSQLTIAMDDGSDKTAFGWYTDPRPGMDEIFEKYNVTKETVLHQRGATNADHWIIKSLSLVPIAKGLRRLFDLTDRFRLKDGEMLERAGIANGWQISVDYETKQVKLKDDGKPSNKSFCVFNAFLTGIEGRDEDGKAVFYQLTTEESIQIGPMTFGPSSSYASERVVDALAMHQAVMVWCRDNLELYGQDGVKLKWPLYACNLYLGLGDYETKGNVRYRYPKYISPSGLKVFESEIPTKNANYPRKIYEVAALNEANFEKWIGENLTDSGLRTIIREELPASVDWSIRYALSRVLLKREFGTYEEYLKKTLGEDVDSLIS